MASMGLDTMLPFLMIAFVGIFVVKMIKDMFDKRKKPQMVEIPRDAVERLTKAYKSAIKGKLNKDRMRHTILLSGDEIVQGYRVGDVVAIQPMNEEYIVYVKPRWWYFWKKALAIHLDPEITTDWNCKEVVIEARGFEATTEGLIYPIPRAGTENLEVIYVQRAKNRHIRVLKQTLADLDVDTDVILKSALRGDIIQAHSEVGRFEEMPSIEDEKLRKRQQKAYMNQGEEG